VSRRIYLDFNASTPICPEAVEALRPFLSDHHGNPSSLHWAGMPAKDAVERARGQVAGILGCDLTEEWGRSGSAWGGRQSGRSWKRSWSGCGGRPRREVEHRGVERANSHGDGEKRHDA